MRWSREFLLERFLARDARYDGRFLTGVVTTGVFCLPSCPARRPRPENVRFFETAEAARAAGLRPCLRCRPECFEPGRDTELETVEALALELRARPGDFPDIASLARRAGVGTTTLTRLLRRHHHVSPLQLLRRARVDRARRELVTGSRRTLDVALDAGFESSSAFHEAFVELAATTPGACRRLAREDELRLELPRDLRIEDTLAFLGRDAESPIERRAGDRFEKAVTLGRRVARIELTLSARGARCAFATRGALAPEERLRLHEVALRLLGLPADPRPFERRAARSPQLRGLVARSRGLRIPQTADAWEGLCWAVLGQQVNLAFACALRRDLARLAGRRAGGGLRAHPSPREVARLEPAELRNMRLSRRKAEYLIDAARAIRAGELPLEELRDRSAVAAERTLLARRGVGPWTAQYLLMRSLGLADCVPAGDAALALALERVFELAGRPDPERTRELMQPFAPYRSFATRHFWKSLGGPP